MAIKFIRAKGATAVVQAPKAEVRKDFDLREEQGKVKFLVHRKKPGIWYRVRSFDEQTGALKLSTTHNKGMFPSAGGKAMLDNYALVVEKAGASEPSAAAIAKVQK